MWDMRDDPHCLIVLISCQVLFLTGLVENRQFWTVSRLGGKSKTQISAWTDFDTQLASYVHTADGIVGREVTLANNIHDLG